VRPHLGLAHVSSVNRTSIAHRKLAGCHVLAHESFEDEVTAKLMNEHYVNIKVDREERPDVDRLYMTFLQATTGGGGWPMSVCASLGLLAESREG